MPVGFLHGTTVPSKTLSLQREIMCRSDLAELLSCLCWGTEMIGWRKCVVKCMSDVGDLPSPLWWQISYWGSVSCWLADWLRSTGKYHLAAKWVIPIAQDAVINGVKGRRGFRWLATDAGQPMSQTDSIKPLLLLAAMLSRYYTRQVMAKLKFISVLAISTKWGQSRNF